MRMMFVLAAVLVFLLGALVPAGAAAGEAGASESKPKIPMPGNMDTLAPCVMPCYDLAVMNSTCAHHIGTDDELLGCMCRTPKFQEQLYLCSMVKCGGLPTLFATMNATNTSCHIPYRDYSGRFAAVTIAFMVLAIVAALLRVGVKTFYQRSDYGLDDAILLAGLLSGLLYCAINLGGMVPNGIGRDAWSLTDHKITGYTYFAYISAILYCLVMGVLKASILAFYLRIFPRTTVRWVIWSTLIFCVLYSIGYALFSALHCLPPESSWLSWNGKVKGKCGGSPAVITSHAAIGIALDLWMLAIPLFMFSTLNLDLRRKIGVSLMFIVGTLDTIISILRLVSLVRLIHLADSSPMQTINLTFIAFEPYLWGTIEINVALVCACMPSMRILLLRVSSILSGQLSSFRSFRGKGSTNPNSAGHYYGSSGGLSSRITWGNTSSHRKRQRPQRGSIILSQGTDTDVDVATPTSPKGNGDKGIMMSRSYDVHDEHSAHQGLRAEGSELDAMPLQDINPVDPRSPPLETPKH